MKIAIAGAGAMGSRFGLMLYRSGNDVVLIDQWHDHVETIKKNGLKANYNGQEITEQIPIFYPQEMTSNKTQVELIIVFTKATQLEHMLQAIKPLIGIKTMVLCLLNGLGHEDILQHYVSKKNILLGITMWTAGLEAPGKAKLFGDGEVELQNIDPAGEAGAHRMVNVLKKAGLGGIYSSNVKYSVWRKACVNGTLNGTCTLLDATIGAFGATTAAIPILKAIISEFAAVAQKEGVVLNQKEILDHVAATFDPNGIGMHYPSMHQDLIKNHRLTEIDYINGAVARKGRAYNLPTPYCTFLTELVHAEEQILKAR
ncbi:2-dehydropantoate 2-reductase [Sporolactobacillus shoreicorticis]|uniref:2-dehydropantoate 2-reductase n=1 Tax=Sporolactobacillus shoreicorticis TaxID=1923877 RepID=A0ABW5RYK6_9BACL|nr:2-dehydropantoate 2-reductase [Sporolactobacillus shoreicorticis]MCO7127920.1 2-dehydropantoate 2-reductase [Sporolactobacillus shoreicorticis]